MCRPRRGLSDELPLWVLAAAAEGFEPKLGLPDLLRRFRLTVWHTNNSANSAAGAIYPALLEAFRTSTARGYTSQLTNGRQAIS